MLRWLTISSLLLFISCKKNLNDVPQQPTPLFYVEYAINGDLNKIKAGEGDYYMFTSAEKDSFKVNQLIGKITPRQNSVKNAFEFKFRSNSKTETSLDSIFTLGDKQLVDTNIVEASDSRIKLKLNALKTQNVIKYNWTINANISSSLKSPEYVFDLNEDNNFPVNLQTSFDTGCVATTSRCIHFDYTDCYADFEFQNTGNLEYHFNITPNYAGDVAHVVWYEKNKQISTEKEFTHVFSTPGLYRVTADVFFKNGCMSCVTKMITVAPSYPSGGCFADFSIEYIPFNNAHYLQLNNVEVNYWDEYGQLYSSLYHKNPGKVEILESSAYNDNENGNKTQKVKLKGAVKLATEDGTEIEIELVDAFIAVGAY